MIDATYFGEIAELDSRAVWYSDEEDDDDTDGDELEIARPKSDLKLVAPANHEIIRANLQLSYIRIAPDTDLNFKSCLVSLSSSANFKNYKLGDMKNLPLLGLFGNYGKVFALPLEHNEEDPESLPSSQEYILWLLFDSNCEYISGYQVGYFVELLREKLQSEFRLDHSNQIIILSKQFSTCEHLEYLNNYSSAAQIKLPFNGRPIVPPPLIRNQFESALFEQLTLSLNLALIVCLPSPRNFWFDKTKNWPSIPKQIIEHKLNDDSLDKTLIFT